MAVNDAFHKYSTYIKNEWKPNRDVSNIDKLILYGLYKQGTCGDCTDDPPWSWQVANATKHNAWMRHNKMDRNVAKEHYVVQAKRIIALYNS